MTEDNINSFIAGHREYFDASQIASIRHTLKRVDDDSMIVMSSPGYRSPTTILLFALFLGCIGVDRFMLGETMLGVLKLVTAGGMGIWSLIDAVTSLKRAKNYNYKLFIETAESISPNIEEMEKAD